MQCQDGAIFRLHNHLFNHYVKEARPVLNQSTTTKVTYRVAIRSLLAMVMCLFIPYFQISPTLTISTKNKGEKKDLPYIPTYLLTSQHHAYLHWLHDWQESSKQYDLGFQRCSFFGILSFPFLGDGKTTLICDFWWLLTAGVFKSEIFCAYWDMLDQIIRSILRWHRISKTSNLASSLSVRLQHSAAYSSVPSALQ